VEPQKTAICSFCSNRGPVVRSNLSGKAVCWECVYSLRVATGTLPTGCIYCFKCSSMKGFCLFFPDMVEWTFGGIDNHEEIIYVVRQTTGAFLWNVQPESCVCTKCRTRIPLWMLRHNRYVHQACNT